MPATLLKSASSETFSRVCTHKTMKKHEKNTKKAQTLLFQADEGYEKAAQATKGSNLSLGTGPLH